MIIIIMKITQFSLAQVEKEVHKTVHSRRYPISRPEYVAKFKRINMKGKDTEWLETTSHHRAKI